MSSHHSGVPRTDRRLLALAGLCLAIPLVALLWVGSYNRETPRLSGIPFFFWYQFLWVFITSALTYTAHRLVLAARARGGGQPAPDQAPKGTAPGAGDPLNPTPGSRS